MLGGVPGGDLARRCYGFASSTMTGSLFLVDGEFEFLVDFPVNGAEGLDGEGDRVASRAGKFGEGADVALSLFESGYRGRVSVVLFGMTCSYREAPHDLMGDRVRVAAWDDMKQEPLQDLVVIEAIDTIFKESGAQALAGNRLDPSTFSWKHRRPF
jgi:hypothetical protein